MSAALFWWSLIASVAPTPGQARVDPLTIIKRQIHKPNMLIVLDTSGSLDGVPGGVFSSASEVGVDCDEGVNCRGGLSVGTCAGSGKPCATDAHCQQSTCSSGFGACASNADCAPIPGTCSTGQSCYTTADCPALTDGHCKATNAVCTAKKSCTPDRRCKHGNGICANDADCKPGLCADGATGCATSNDCPYQTTGGTCAYGTTPASGCSTVTQCPARPKVCSDDPNKTCTTASDCGGTCKKGGQACTSDANCNTKPSDSCQFTKTCSAPANSCILPHQACTLSRPDNACQDLNPCIGDPNPCSGSTTNQCRPGQSNDLCNASGSSGGVRMCRISQTICTNNGSCSASGDSCGPATSRFVIAKRALRQIVSANANVVNFGLMTFYQSGYFPYYSVSGGTTTTETATISHGQLQANKCFTKKTGLQSTCEIDGVTYKLKGGNNTRYLIKGGPGDDGKYHDYPYCGFFCTIPGVGTGIIKGAYYEYDEVKGTANVLTVMPSYQGKSFTQGGVTYRYYDARPDYYNGGQPPPISVPSCGNSCSANCGGRWDTQLAPFLSTDDSSTTAVEAFTKAFTQWMQPASYGGLIAYGGTPTGCTLENSAAPDKNHSAYHYMKDVIAQDTLSCRQNFILLVTDGEANGPGDVACSSSACAASDPVSAGCSCKAVLAAYNLRQKLGVKTFVVGFSVEAAAGSARLTNDNIAKAGGTDVSNDGTAPYAFTAANETELTKAIQGAVYQAVQGSYATAPATASQGSQQGNTAQSGSYVLDSRVDFPSWKGHLLAYDVSGQAPVLVWDAATKLAQRDWRTRKVYTSDGSNNLVQIDIDPSTGTIKNAGLLASLGLGATSSEADSIARWMLGDPQMGNPAVLGAIINSTPIDVAAPPDSPLPGGHEFYLKHLNRPALTYIGSDDGMLHAFFTKTVTVGNTTYSGGDEAFAYIPPGMLPIISGLYAQGGQLADPKQHVYGLLASSAKVKNLCTENCNDAANAKWRTVLVMTAGWGGNQMFVADISDPIPKAGGHPFQVMWYSKTIPDASRLEPKLGLTVSVPAFLYNQTDPQDDYRLIFASGYPVDDASTSQGRYLISVSAKAGNELSETFVPAIGECRQDYTNLTDISLSRANIRNPNGLLDGRKSLIAAYSGDTWGNLWQFSLTDGLKQVASLGCEHPLHFSPTVVQLDQDNPSNSHTGEIYLAQVTNSTLDEDTQSYAPSKLVLIKQLAAGGVATVDTTFGSNGLLTLTAGNTSQLCAATDVTGSTCLTPLPSNARPLSSPLAVPTIDGNGFLLLSHWYVAANQGCGKGATYLIMHSFLNGELKLKQALKVADEPVWSPVLVAGKVMIVGSTGATSVASSLTTSFTPTPTPTLNGEPFRMTGWSEIQ